LIYTTYSKLQGTRDELKRTHLEVLKYLGLLGFPACVGIFILAPDFITLAYGEQWVDMIPVVRFIMGYTLIGILNSPLLELYKALGRPDIRLKYSIGRGVGTFVAFLIGIRYGVPGMAIAHSVSAFVFGPINFYISMRLLKIKLMDIVTALWVPCGAALCMFLIAPAVQTIVGSGSWIGLFVNGVVMGLVYLIALFAFNPALMGDVKRLGLSLVGFRAS
jgi:O-antigen/teichoic acid export membrane protein